MVPVILASGVLTFTMVWFNDQVLPRSNHRLRTLQTDIARKKPTFALREQVIEPSLTFNPGLVFGGTNVSYAEDTATASAFGKSNVIARDAEVLGDLRYLSPEIEWEFVGIDERWREELKVVFRKRPAAKPNFYPDLTA